MAVQAIGALRLRRSEGKGFRVGCWLFILLGIWLADTDCIFPVCDCYTHSPCTRQIAAQFALPDCYIPPLDNDLLLSEASFLMSHDAATGYLPKNHGASSATNLYAKNQIGSVYDQLQDGARALDLRPKLLQNGTVVLHHGAIPVPVTLQTLVNDVLRWSAENPDELILLMHLKLTYASGLTPSADTAVGALSDVYESLGVAYLSCEDVYGLTIGDVIEVATHPTTGGAILALDRHDAYASTCIKMNYIADAIVTCYPSNTTIPCTRPNTSPALDLLHSYALASANNEPSDNSNDLGPAASVYSYPFSAIQALWQVNARSAAMGMAHLSSILDDNTKSRINARVVDWVYQGDFSVVSLLLVDHVQLNGNAILSVLRTTCGQSELAEDACGPALPKPHLQQKPMSTLFFFFTCSIYLAFGVWLFMMVRHYKAHYNHDQQMKRLQNDLQSADQQFQRVMAGQFA